MFEFLVADWPDGDPNQQNVFRRLHGPAIEDLRDAFLTDDPNWYGTHFVLVEQSVGEFVALCVSEIEATETEDGRFLVYHNDDLVSSEISRFETL